MTKEMQSKPENNSPRSVDAAAKKSQLPLGKRVLRIGYFLLWPTACYLLASLLLAGVVVLIAQIVPDFYNRYIAAQDNTMSFVLTASMTTIWIALLFTVPLIFKKKYSLRTFGLRGLPSWADIGLSILGYVIFVIIAGAAMAAIAALFPSIDMQQAQETGFTTQIGMSSWQYLAAFFALVIVAPIAEEFIFRGFIYTNIRRFVGWVPAAVLTSLVFAALHFQLNVVIAIFFLSIVLCLLREFTGKIWASILLHMIKNAVAFVVLFILPALQFMN